MTLRFLPLIGAMAVAVVGLSFSAGGSAAQSLKFNYETSTYERVSPYRKYRGRKPKAKFWRRTVSIRTEQKPGTIIIDTNRKYLYYVLNERRAVRYGVGVGREGFGWEGEVKVRRKAEWPTWTPPKEMRIREWRENKRRLPIVQKGGLDNPMGARALYLFKGNRDTQYRIHGTNEPWSIGLSMSSGCIRMMNEDVEDLYERAKVGTKVVVIGPKLKNKRIYREGGLFALFGG
ncbi:MAG: L,D-transpeptidase [Pseudomonadota bacterium]